MSDTRRKTEKTADVEKRYRLPAGYLKVGKGADPAPFHAYPEQQQFFGPLNFSSAESSATDPAASPILADHSGPMSFASTLSAS